MKLPDIKRNWGERPKQCPYCKGGTFQRWGQTNKPVKDAHERNVQIYRYRCCNCHRTFRHYPDGLTRAKQTKMLKMLVVLLWGLGLSCRMVQCILNSLQVKISFMSIWRDVQKAKVYWGKGHNHWKLTHMASLDQTSVFSWENKQAALVVLDLGPAGLIPLGCVNKYDSQTVQYWLEALVQKCGLQVTVTDDLFSYKVMTVKR